MKFSYTKKDILNGLLIYSTGDTIASLILHQFSIGRLSGMMLVGGLIYSLEIPYYFRWIDKKTASIPKRRVTSVRTLLAIAYFNPVWIARHLFFIKIFSGSLNEIQFGLLVVAGQSFLVNIPISFIANYLIQNSVPLRWRFLASALFSALMAIYYAVSAVIFH